MRNTTPLLVLAVFGALLCVVCAQDGEYLRTPAGYVPRELLVTHTLHEAVRVIPKCDTKGGTRKVITRNPPGLDVPSNGAIRQVDGPLDYDGWLAYTAFNYSKSFDAFLGNFDVPAKPEDDPDVLYLFTGLQNIDWIPVVDPDPTQDFDIIQPVLQYPGDNGDYWSVKSWYVTLDVGTVASDEVELEVGDVIFGNMTRTGTAEWYIGSVNTNSGKTTSVTVNHPRLASQPWAYNTLECYGCNGCSTYPANSPIHFTNLTLISKGVEVTPTWKVDPKPSKLKQCKEHAIVEDPQTVTIDFGNDQTLAEGTDGVMIAY